jgi:capsular exopolysaccharide synthesis family protein
VRRPAEPLAAPPPAEDDRPVVASLRVLYRRRWIAATAVALVLLAVTVQTFTAVPVYEARTRLLIDADTPNVVEFKEIVEPEGGTFEYLQTQYKVLESRTLARRTIDALGWWDHPEFGGGTREPSPPSLRDRMVETARSLADRAGLSQLRVAEPPARDERADQARVIDTFTSRLAVVPVRFSRLVDVTFRSTDPVLAARAVNQLATSYIQQTLEFRFTASKDATDWLADQLAEQRRAVAESEAALQRYREEHDAVALEDRQNIVVQKLADLNAAVTRAKTDRIAREAQYQQLRVLARNPNTLDSFPAILANPYIQQLKGDLAELVRRQSEMVQKLGPKHPDRVRLATAIESTEARLRLEVDKVVQAVRTEFLAAAAQEHSLVQSLEAQKKEALALNRREIDYGVLLREAESNRQLYDGLLQRTKEAGVSRDLETSNVRVLDAADVPRGPVSPRVRTNLTYGFVGGLFLAGWVVFLLEHLDSRVKTPADLRTGLGLPSIGVIPELRAKAHIAKPVITGDVPGQFIEAFRTAETNLLFSWVDPGLRSLVVTSAMPGEGKTVVAGNLAVALAQSGQRVLLVDADLRRPRIHDLLGLAREPGLTNLLVGRAGPEDVVVPTDVAGLSVVTAGQATPSPVQLLGSPRLGFFLNDMEARFDWIVLDAPPVLPVADVAAAAQWAAATLLVVGAEMTNRQTVREAVERLRVVRVPVVGAILNRVDFHRHGYHYAPYYRPEYSDYYRDPGLSARAGQSAPSAGLE